MNRACGRRRQTHLNGAVANESMRTWVVKIGLACCIIAFAAFLKPTLTDRLESVVARGAMSKAAGGAYDTTDRYLSPLEIPNPSEAALKAMADVPPEDAMVFVTSNGDEHSELVYRTLAYLGWPRPIGEARCGEAGKPPQLLFQPRDGQRIKWLFFYRVKPPAELAQTSRTIGPHLILTMVELKEWKSYCSQ